MRRKECLYAVIGGVVGAVLTMAVCSVLPLGAQSQSDGVFGEITCTGLKVVNAEGITRVELFDNEDGGGIWIVGEDLWEARLNSGELSVGNRREWTTLHREGLWVLGKDGGSVQLVNTAQGGRVSVDDNVVIDATEHGGRVTVFGKGSDESRAVMKSGEHGGSVIVFGKGDSKGQAGMGVNEYGNGGVSTWDKNGYRLTTLK